MILVALLKPVLPNYITILESDSDSIETISDDEILVAQSHANIASYCYVPGWILLALTHMHGLTLYKKTFCLSNTVQRLWCLQKSIFIKNIE